MFSFLSVKYLGVKLPGPRAARGGFFKPGKKVPVFQSSHTGVYSSPGVGVGPLFHFRHILVVVKWSLIEVLLFISRLPFYMQSGHL